MSGLGPCIFCGQDEGFHPGPGHLEPCPRYRKPARRQRTIRPRTPRAAPDTPSGARAVLGDHLGRSAATAEVYADPALSGVWAARLDGAEFVVNVKQRAVEDVKFTAWPPRRR